MREVLIIVTVLAPLSLVSFGGGASILAPMQEAFVVTHRWITAREFVDFFAISRASPGPGAMLVALIGWTAAGWAGALAATLAIFLPSSILCYRVARIWNTYRGTPLHQALERGLLPIGTGLTVSGAMITQRTADTGWMGWAVAITAAAVVVSRRVHPLVVLAGGAAAMLGARSIGL